MQGPWLKSHPKLQPWYFIQGLGAMLQSGNCSDITTISQDAEDLFYKACSAPECTNQSPPCYRKTLQLWGDVTAWTAKETAAPCWTWMSLFLNEHTDYGRLYIGGRMGRSKVMLDVRTQKLECLSHLPSTTAVTCAQSYPSGAFL